MKKILFTLLILVFALPVWSAQTIYPGHKWDLYDSFTNALSAGSINGTLSDGTQHKRTVTDTGSKLSITGGNSVFNAGVSAWGNPGIYYPAVTREAGKMLFVAINHNNTYISDLFWGWSAAASGLPASNSFWTTGSGSVIGRAVSGVGPAIGTISYQTSYVTLNILRRSGAFFFIKGGLFLNWTLLDIASNSTTGTLYPCIANFDSKIISSFIGIPSKRWLPTPLLSHGFQSAITPSDGAGHSESTGLGSGGAGLTMTSQLGTWDVSGQKAISSALDGTLNISILTANLSTVNQVISADLTRASAGNVGIVFRYTDSSNYNRCYQDGTNVKCDDVIAGSATNKLSAAATYGAGRTMTVIDDGAAVRCYYFNVLIGTYTTSNTTGSNTGIYTSDTGNIFDNLYVLARGTEGQYSNLDEFINPN